MNSVVQTVLCNVEVPQLQFIAVVQTGDRSSFAGEALMNVSSVKVTDEEWLLLLDGIVYDGSNL